MKLSWTNLELSTKHEFRISRGSSGLFQNLLVEIEHEGRIGRGEVSAATYHGETRETAATALGTWAAHLGQDPWEREAILTRCQEVLPGNHAALSGLDCALWDLCAQEAGQPLWRLLGVDRSRMPLSSLTLGISDWETTQKKLEEARGFPILKIKMGIEGDIEMMRRIRGVTDRRITVDANSGWDLETATRRVGELADLGIEMVEQPLAEDDLEGFERLRRISPLPIYADESIGTSADVARFAKGIHGVNLKLAKTGGITEALRVIATARAHGLAVMIGCMIESSLGITSAAHIAPLVDHLDLDSHWLIADDPFTGIGGGAGRLELPTSPGLGVSPSARGAHLTPSPRPGGSTG
jgi:L-alanine-DL-glutamate epimerase-like enolase superfamily enzyme